MSLAREVAELTGKVEALDSLLAHALTRLGDASDQTRRLAQLVTADQEATLEALRAMRDRIVRLEVVVEGMTASREGGE